MTGKNGVSYVYGARPHAALFVGEYALAYDANGNMTGRENATGTQTLTFDVENRLSQVQGTGGGYSGTSTYVYDGDGTRIKKIGGGNTTVYVNQYYEKDITAGVATSHYYLGGTQVAIKKGSTLEYIHQDHLGSSSLSTDSSGNPISTMKVFSFGDRRNSTGTLGTDRQFTGQRLDGTGLYFYEARYYDPAVCRFISPDQFVQNGPGFDLISSALTVNLAKTGFEIYPQAISSAPIDPQTLNRYSYVLNNPLRYTDPHGWWTFGFGFTISIGAGGGFSFSAMLVISGRGEVAANWSGGGGGYAGAGGSIMGQVQMTNAESVEQLRGPQVQIGASGGEVVVGGAEYVVGRGYQGMNLQPGVGVGLSPVEMHGIIEDAGVKLLVGSDTDGTDTSGRGESLTISSESYRDPYYNPFYYDYYDARGYADGWWVPPVP